VAATLKHHIKLEIPVTCLLFKHWLRVPQEQNSGIVRKVGQRTECTCH